MNENKNIDRLFQEKFKDFEAVPNEAVWNRISESLPKKKKKRRVIALWWQIGGVAAVIALMLTVGSSIFNSDPETSPDTEIVDENNTDESIIEEATNPSNANQDPTKTHTDSKTIELAGSDSDDTTKSITEDEDPSATQKKGLNTNDAFKNKDPKTNAIANRSETKDKPSFTETPNNPKVLSTKNNNAKVADNTSSKDTQKEPTILDDPKAKSVIKETIKNGQTAVTANDPKKTSEVDDQNNTVSDANNTDLDNQEETTAFEDPKKESIESAIAAQEEINEKEKEDEQNRWSIAPNVAPVYFSSLGEGSSIDAQFNENSKSGDINMSYGITGTYALSKKLKLRAGVNRVNLSQTTSDVFAFTGGEFASRGGEQSQMGNITTKTDLGNITLMSANAFNRSTTPEIFNTKIAGDLDQRFGFIEVPLEIEYRLLDKRFGLNVIGGFSTFFLNQNEIYADIDGTSTLIGESSNINSTSFSANFGLGLDYSLSKQWYINLEPQFKYQINTFNNTSGNFRPFFIGVYTGLNFKF